jgi:hypothetical protein
MKVETGYHTENSGCFKSIIGLDCEWCPPWFRQVAFCLFFIPFCYRNLVLDPIMYPLIVLFYFIFSFRLRLGPQKEYVQYK